MRTRYWIGHMLKTIAKDIEKDYPQQAEQLRQLSVMAETMKGTHLDQEPFVCNCGSLILGNRSDIARHLKTHS